MMWGRYPHIDTSTHKTTGDRKLLPSQDDVDEDDDDDFMMLRPFQYNNYLKEILSCLIVPHLYS
jgi:hypothetical protein